MWQLTNQFLFKWMAWLAACPASSPYFGPLCDIWMGLYQTPTPPITSNSTFANITEATYDGYARQEVVWFPPFLSVDGSVTLKGASQFFQPTDGLVMNQITGAFLATSSTGGLLDAAAVAPTPGFSFTGTQSGLLVTPVLKLPFVTVYGGPEWDG